MPIAPEVSDSVDLYSIQEGEDRFVGRVLYVDGEIRAEGGPEIEELAARTHGKLFKRGRLVNPFEGREFLRAIVEQYDGVGLRAMWTSESEFRDAVGEERYGHLRTNVRSLPEAIDRSAVWRALTVGVHARDGWALVEPAWCSDRDAAVRAVGRAIARFKRVLQRSRWPRSSELAETTTAGLEREYRLLVDGATVEDGRRSVPVMMLDRARLGWPRPGRGGGRPTASWRTDTAKALRALGVPGLDAERLLEAAGLTGKTPRRSNPKD